MIFNKLQTEELQGIPFLEVNENEFELQWKEIDISILTLNVCKKLLEYAKQRQFSCKLNIEKINENRYNNKSSFDALHKIKKAHQLTTLLIDNLNQRIVQLIKLSRAIITRDFLELKHKNSKDFDDLFKYEVMNYVGAKAYEKLIANTVIKFENLLKNDGP